MDGNGVSPPIQKHTITPTIEWKDGTSASYMRWGLIPSWAKSASVGSHLINARAETVAERNSFRSALIR